MKHVLMALLLVLPARSFAQAPSAEEILRRVDRNAVSDTRVVVSRMVIHGRRGERTVEARSWQRHASDAFTEYLAPPRDAGTKMLKLGDQLWTYSPDTDRTILLSGHMLRQSLMGSDLSYEDMMEDPLLEDLYAATNAGSDTVRDRPAWVLDLKAKTLDIVYDARRIWVDKERLVILKETLYAKSGVLLKQVDVREMMQAQGRWVAKSALFKDVLKEGDGTELIVDAITFDQRIPDVIFSKASLRK
jgi:outer membrane lipoprotein-sorting protein